MRVRFSKAVSAAAIAVLLAGCGGGPSQSEFDAEQAAKVEAQEAARVAAEAKAAADAAKAAADAEAARKAAEAEQARKDAEAAAEAARKAAEPANRQMALINSALDGLTTALAALDEDDPTAAQIAAVNAAINLLDDALKGADDLTPTQTADAGKQLAAARMTVAGAETTRSEQMSLAERRDTQSGAISTAQTALGNALEALDDTDAETITAVNTAITALQEAVGEAEDLTDAEKMMAMSDLMDAEVSAATAELAMYTAAAMAEGASNEDMLAAYEGKLEAATRLVAALTANDGSAADVAAANRVIGSATAMVATLKEKIQMAKDAEANAARLARNAVSMKVAEAINAHTLVGTPMVFETGSTDTVADPDFTISRSSGDAMFTLGQTAAEKRSKPYTMSSAPSAGTGWMGNTFTHSGTSGKRPFTEMASVYTDIEMAGDAAWTTAGLGAHAGTGVTVTTNGPVTIGDTASLGASRFTGGILPSAPPADNDDGTEREFDAGTVISGTFYGVSGNFSCAADCVVTRDNLGNVTVDADVIFTPTGAVPAGGRMAKYADPDMDYTYFGYWMESTTQRDGTKTHDIETFYGGGNGDTLALGDSTTATVLGTAKYYGAAAGVYVKKDGASDSLVVTDGTFTADAMLTARFGGSTIAENDQYEVQGTISDFMDGGTDLGFADLTLRGPANNPSGASFDAAGAITGGETDGGGTSGNWSGQFYGNTGAGTTVAFPNGNDAESDDYPSDVAGEFNGHFVNGHVAGAFGAEYDK